MLAVEDAEQDELIDAVVTDEENEDSCKEILPAAEIDSKEEPEKVKKKRKRIKYKAKKLVFNIAETKYQVVRYVAKKLFNMRLSAYS
jgi:mRNA-degrading endonuclease HigB of HigAB toxin-antitoxin module